MLQNKSFDSAGHERRVEVDQQPQLLPRDSQIRQTLRFENRIEPFDALDFNHDCFPDEQIQAMFSDSLAFVDHRYSYLSTELHAFVSDLQQTSSQVTMHLNGTTDDRLCNLVQIR